VVTHGNGPQVGNLLLADEVAKNAVSPMSLDVLGAQTEGYMGYMIQNTLANHLRQAGALHNITTVVSQVVVDRNAPAFKDSSKPIGSSYSANTAGEGLGYHRRQRSWIPRLWRK